MRLSLFALGLTLTLTACRFESRPDGNNPQQTTADDIEFNRGEVLMEDETGTTPAAPPDTMGVLDATVPEVEPLTDGDTLG